MSWRDDIERPHNLTPRQLLRVVVICVVALIALLVAVVYAHAQPAPKMEVPAPAVGVAAPSVPNGGDSGNSFPLKAALGSYLTFSVIDAKQTGSCLAAGRCRETNPLLQPFAGKPSVLVPVKLAANSATAYAIWQMRKKHPKAALVLAITSASFQAVVVAQNARAARASRGAGR